MSALILITNPSTLPSIACSHNTQEQNELNSETIPWCVVKSQDNSLCLTPRGPAGSCTVRYPGLGSHAQSGILARGVMHSEVSWLGESCTVRYPDQRSHAQWGILARGVMNSEVSWPGESCTVRYPGQQSHEQWGILASGVMHSEVSWPGESWTVRYTGQGSHAQWGILARGVMHSEVSWPVESSTYNMFCYYLFILLTLMIMLFSCFYTLCVERW